MYAAYIYSILLKFYSLRYILVINQICTYISVAKCAACDNELRKFLTLNVYVIPYRRLCRYCIYDSSSSTQLTPWRSYPTI